ncbi:MAG: DUF2797 domain-containing protein [Candidatus Aenigmarchaeota archaeon]|nr:DUF2797 domain-containing protein [Candidatus Aenigmarchaeota archaeon]
MQIIKYKWQDWSPHFVVRDGGELKKMDLLGKDINFRIGKNICTGFMRDGKHFPCKNRREVVDSICNECKPEDDYFFCIRCDGSECINRKKRDECQENYYYIYLAAFGHMLKVGISHEFRLLGRLVEQGADFGAKIARVQDGKLVRAMEQQIKKEINVVDRITGEQKFSTLFGNPNIAVANIFRAVSLLKTNGFSQHLIGPEVYDLREYYNLQNVLLQPQETAVHEGLDIDGRVVSAKGNLIILQKEKMFFSVNAHRLVGREILAT